MSWSRRFQALGILGLAGGGLLIWLAFQPGHLMCPHERIVDSCNPSFRYLIPGILGSLMGLGLIGYGSQYRLTDSSSEPGEGS